MRKRTQTIATTGALATIVLGACGLALAWAVHVPIFQAPDEPLHLDYALAIMQHRGLLHPTQLEPNRNNNSYENIFTHNYAHPYTRYLLEATAAGTIAFNPPAKVPPDYGSVRYFQTLDAHAPRVHSDLNETPFLYRLYPFGYYAVLAGWISAWFRHHESIVSIFFSARLLSVLLLAVNLLFVYATLRELRYRRRAGLFITAAIGFFPLTTFVASYVQPDNLSFLLVNVCFYLALALRNRLNRCALPWAIALGVALVALFLTKWHYFLVVAVPILPMLLGEFTRVPLAGLHRVVLGSALLLPSLAGGIWYLRIAPSENVLLTAAEAGQCDGNQPAVWSQRAFRDFYIGLSHQSFWGNFGWLDTPLVIHSAGVTQAFRACLTLTTLLVLLLVMAHFVQIARRWLRLLRRGRWQTAWRIAFSNPLINSYFLFTALMFVLYVRFHNAFGGQGRNWLPLLLPFMLTGIAYVPRALGKHQLVAPCASFILGAILAFDGIGAWWAWQSISERYYTPFHGSEYELVRLESGWSEEGQLTYYLPARRFVYGIEFCYTHHNRLLDRSELSVAWASVRQPVQFSIIPGDEPRTLTVWVNDTIDCIHLQPDAKTTHFRILDIRLLGRPDDRPLAAR